LDTDHDDELTGPALNAAASYQSSFFDNILDLPIAPGCKPFSVSGYPSRFLEFGSNTQGRTDEISETNSVIFDDRK
jgi:hypothetical protein